MSKSDEPHVPASAADRKASLAAKAKLMEGVDFIENEGDVVAVESAALKIQSTFRGRKIRSKLGQKPADPAEAAAAAKPALSENKNSNLITSANQQQEDSLSKKLATMQVEDKTAATPASGAPGQGEKAPATTTSANLPEDVAATKIQAGFKGYKTRKELAEEGKLASSGGQGQPTEQADPGDAK